VQSRSRSRCTPGQRIRPRRFHHRLGTTAGRLPAGQTELGVVDTAVDHPLRPGQVRQGGLRPMPGQVQLHPERPTPAELLAPAALRTAGCRPSRTADHSLEGELRDARRHREHRQRVRQRPRHATSPLPQPDQDPRPARPHAIAVNTERVNADPTTPTADRQPRTLTALQNLLDRHRIPRPTAWRIAGKS
jgi:hypothetical protein